MTRAWYPVTICGLFFFAVTLAPMFSHAESRVGVILPLSGEFAFVGRAIQQGIMLRKQEGGLDSVHFLIEDDKTYETQAVLTAFRKLTDLQKVPLLFVTTSPVLKPIAPLVTKSKVPTIAIWDYSDELVDPARYLFNMGYSNERAGEVMAELAVNRLEPKRVSVITADDEWSERVSRSFIDRFKARGGAIDLHENVDLSSSDLRSLLAKIKGRDSPGIFFPLYLQSFTTVVKQARELRYEGELFTGEGLTEMEWNNLGSLLEGIVFQRIWVNDENFIEKYKRVFGKQSHPADIGFVGIGYDLASLVALLGQHLEGKSVKSVRENLAKRLKQIRFEGVTGRAEFATFKGKPLRNLIVKNGKIESLEADG